ncbi:hypothetical protein ALC57_13018 [Trachymyrmex cornetzi]|uniref:Uncharacterized protein n=1 Tax=Trachymyrmex cornetzi TaxID=471704 RepID=A0A151J002_9HYME|nr:hypothetical protein ALC57_13018 [Trachymyrmex cornetzi]
MAARSSCLQHAEESASDINPARSAPILSSYPAPGVASPAQASPKDFTKPVSKEISLVRPKCETGPESPVRSPTRQVEVCPSVVF